MCIAMWSAIEPITGLRRTDEAQSAEAEPTAVQWVALAAASSADKASGNAMRSGAGLSEVRADGSLPIDVPDTDSPGRPSRPLAWEMRWAASRSPPDRINP